MRQLTSQDASQIVADAYNDWKACPHEPAEQILSNVLAKHMGLHKNVVRDHLIDDDGQPRFLGYEGITPMWLQIEPDDFQFLVDYVKRMMKDGQRSN